MLTSCPECATNFRVTQEQLGVRRGMVRCGRCGAVFNAYDNLQAEIDAPAPTHAAAAPAWSPPPPPHAAPPAETRAPPAQAETPRPAIMHQPAEAPKAVLAEPAGASAPPVERAAESKAVEARAAEVEFDTGWLDGMREDSLELGAAPGDAASDEGARTRLENIDEILLSELPGRRARVAGDNGAPLFWVLAACLALALLGQLTFFLRVELANWQPAMRPILNQACAALGCAMPLATDINVLRIEASSLETDPEQAAHARLRVTFSNRAAEAVEWPYFVLKLSDVGNVAMAQRVFKPADYLGKGGKPAPPHMAPRSEHEFHLDLDMGTLSAAGYEVKPYYP
jgi:predicted Zn finger-like uncharacterized protein